MSKVFVYWWNALICRVSYLQIDEKNCVTFRKNKYRKAKGICSMWNISCVHKHCHNVHGLCTHIYVQNFGILEIVAHTRCTQTYFCVHEKICMQIFSFSIPVSIMLFVKGFSFNSILKVNASSPVSKQKFPVLSYLQVDLRDLDP